MPWSTSTRELDDATEEAELAAVGVALAPEMLGGEGTRRYFLAFVTPVELRGSGGFIGSYGVLEATDGKLRLVRSGGATELERAVPDGTVQITGPPDYLARYGRYQPGDYFRDLTFSPHFPYDGQVIAEAYPQTGGEEVDGVISIDPIALASLLRLTGPIRVEGFDRTLNARNAGAFLLKDNYELFPDNRVQTAALTELTETTFDRLTSGDLPAPRAWPGPWAGRPATAASGPGPGARPSRTCSSASGRPGRSRTPGPTTTSWPSPRRTRGTTSSTSTPPGGSTTTCTSTPTGGCGPRRRSR